MYASLLVGVFLVARHRGKLSSNDSLLPWALAASVALAITQEGAEILVYVSGFLRVEEFASSVSIGSVTGAGIGFSVGVLFFYLLLALPERRALVVSLVLLGFIGASMCIQATNLLIQADWVQSGAPLWDSSGLVMEDSLVGQLLYALVGYEASPSAVEAGMYGVGLVSIILAALIGWKLLSAEQEPQ